MINWLIKVILQLLAHYLVKWAWALARWAIKIIIAWLKRVFKFFVAVCIVCGLIKRKIL